MPLFQFKKAPVGRAESQSRRSKANNNSIGMKFRFATTWSLTFKIALLTIVACTVSIHVFTSLLSQLLGGTTNKIKTSHAHAAFMKQHAQNLRSEAEMIRQKERRQRQYKVAPQENKNTNNNDNDKKTNIHFVSYGSLRYANSKRRIRIEAERTGWFESVHVLGPGDLPQQFKDEFDDILRMRRGGGYWLWKFPVWEKMLHEVPVGDYILYADAGCQVNPNQRSVLDKWVQMLQNSTEYDFLSFQISSTEEVWTTERIFEAFSVASDNSLIRKSGQIISTVKLIRNGANARDVVANLYDVLRADPYIITDQYNAEAKNKTPAFQDNRHDQSITSVLLKTMGSVVTPDVTYGPSLDQTLSPIVASRLILSPGTTKKITWLLNKLQ